ncbi:MAG: histidine kinase [Ferruginibacter sp.]
MKWKYAPYITVLFLSILIGQIRYFMIPEWPVTIHLFVSAGQFFLLLVFWFIIKIVGKYFEKKFPSAKDFGKRIMLQIGCSLLLTIPLMIMLYLFGRPHMPAFASKQFVSLAFTLAIVIVILLNFGLSAQFFFRKWQKSIEDKKNIQLELLETKQKQAEIEMKALRAQMNPHFIFNSLNSINKYILTNDQVNASKYLTRFAKLIRLILDNSNSREVAVSDELEALRLYIEMELLRFTNKFSYEIKVDKDVSADTIQIPPLIIQPFVENAIWHGLLHKETEGKLSISVRRTIDSMLQCCVEDNGIGRIKAREMKSKSATTNKSMGMKLTEERINMLNKNSLFKATVSILDLQNEHCEPTGTKVIITIPF